jgi:hypothetical protein
VKRLKRDEKRCQGWKFVVLVVEKTCLACAGVMLVRYESRSSRRVETRQVGYEFKSLIYCSRNEIYIRKLHCSSELHEPCIEVYGLMSELDPSYHILRPQ